MISGPSRTTYLGSGPHLSISSNKYRNVSSNVMVSRPNSQTTMRLLHYFALSEVSDGKVYHRVYHRAGAHADWDFVTLLFQRDGQDGLEICPGREVVTEFDIGGKWTKAKARTGELVCNIGDLLMS